MLKIILASCAVLVVLGCGAPEFDPPPEPPAPPLFGEIVNTKATWYGSLFHGRMMNNGEMYDMEELTASHASLPFGAKVEVTNPENKKSVRVVITDRHNLKEGVDLCLSKKAAEVLGTYPETVFPVQFVVIE